MNLHKHTDDFSDLVSITAAYKHIPESAVERDYYIVLLLQNLENSEFAAQCVFKGGTSLSKCYPDSIERFSEDIDLTFLGMNLNDKTCGKTIKRIEKAMTEGFNTEKIVSERSDRSKSMMVWYNSKENRIKLEIGSSVRPDPYSKKEIKTYIQEFLEEKNYKEAIEYYELHKVTLNVLNIERTFVDKLMAVKRHAICGRLEEKVRHIYDVKRLYSLPEIQRFLDNREELKHLIQMTKDTDSFYLGKRNISKEYNPAETYSFENWNHYFNQQTRYNYEHLHKELLYTDEPQNFGEALEVFSNISEILRQIGE